MRKAFAYPVSPFISDRVYGAAEYNNTHCIRETEVLSISRLKT